MSYAMDQGPRPHLITVDEYHRMAEAGLIAPDARVELIEGVIIDMAPIGPLHAAAVDRLSKLLTFAVDDRAIVRTQGPLSLARWLEPQPDIAVLTLRAGSYAMAHPTGHQALLVVEVTDSRRPYDFDAKLALYARHGVREVWIADVSRSEFHTFRARTDIGYSVVDSTREPGKLEVPSLEGTSVDLTGLFEFDLQPD